MTERTLFLALLEIDDPAQRCAFLDESCAKHPELRRDVERLLQAHTATGDFMARPAAALIPGDSDASAIHEGPGTVIGPYQLLEQIGEGGFGVVFMAEQQAPLRRRVAVKVLKPGMDTRQVVARFEAERQALALMAHPNIAQVLDGGATDSGRPYFVMELVRGVPITDFCDQNQLDLRARLDLFVAVCRAIQHAHQKGIIHRDLKPSNLLVTLRDTTPVVKVIDFGIAKATGQQLTDKTLCTNFAQLLGTPLYMSPEQAQLGGLDVDTRTDIYSLGVLLYELLTGTTPFERERLRAVAHDEIRRIIREEEAPKPSRRLHALAQRDAALSTGPRSDPERLRQVVRGELDWIVMKALEKDRNRRYDTVSALAADVERYLRDEPVEACPPSRWYRFRKLVRRNKPTVVAIAALSAAVVLGVAALVANNVLVRHEQARTQGEMDRADEAQRLAEKRAEEIRLGLEGLKSANALLDRGRWYVSQTRLDDAHVAFTRAIELRPDHASVWAELGDLHGGLGLWEVAAADYARELELREPDSTLRWYRHALLRLYQGDRVGYAHAMRCMEERFRGATNWVFLLELVRARSLSPELPEGLAPPLDLAEHLLRDHATDWYCLYVSGMAHYRAGQFSEAAQQLRRSLTGAAPASIAALGYPILALAHQRLGEAAQARQALAAATTALDRWTEDMYQPVQDEWHWVNDLGGALHWPLAWWDILEFRLFYAEAKLLIDGVAPPEDARWHALRGRALAALRRNGTADVEYATAVRLRPQDNQLRYEAHRSHGYTCIGQNRWRDAADEFRRACDLRPDEVHLWYFRAVCHAVAGESDAYRETCAAMLERFESTSDRRVVCFVLAACVLRDGALAGPMIAPAAEHEARLAKLVRLVPAQNDFGISCHGASLYRASRFAEAISTIESAAKIYAPRARDWCFLAMAHHRLGHTAEAQRCLAEAIRWIGDANRAVLDEPTGSRPAWADWPERAEYPLLLHEAQERLTGNAQR
jgi:eukaryotic-like serine/threonine-protein kinase